MTQIAIDGPASSGKSSVGIRVAASFGYGFLDTGLLYRAVTRAALDGGVLGATGALLQGTGTISAGDAEKLVQLAHLADVDLESGSATIVVDGIPFEASELEGGDVERAVAAIAAIPEVRAALRTAKPPCVEASCSPDVTLERWSTRRLYTSFSLTRPLRHARCVEQSSVALQKGQMSIRRHCAA